MGFLFNNIFIIKKTNVMIELKRGSKGEQVKLVQRALGLDDDGIFGFLTETAIKEFQKKNKLCVTGIVGPNTWAKLGLTCLDLTTKLITSSQLGSITGIKDIEHLERVTNSINDTLIKFEINTPLRICHFLAQLFHESGRLTVTVENLNYSEQGLLKIFGKYFTPALAKEYARKPKMIASRVYANRMNNGDEASQDGWKFRGRGYIQLTGKSNYTRISNDLNIDFISQPELLSEPKYAALSAGWYWNGANLNVYADKDDVRTITKKINGGYNGLDDRISYLNKLKAIIK